MALAALLLDELDDDALRALARRLAPHLGQLEAPNQHARIAYTVRSLAAELGLSPKAVRCAIRRGELRAVKRGSRWIIASDAVADWATASEPRRARSGGCPASAPKAAGPSLRSVLCGGGAR
jgi:excisionase family DNA binding protein